MQKAIILKRIIDESGLSVRKVSIMAGIPYTTLCSMLENGVGKSSVDNVLKVCKVLGITTDDLERMASDENDIITIAAHHDGEDWSEEERKELENFKAYLRSKRENKQ